jgi:molecular chaperone DnaK (HSP70)
MATYGIDLGTTYSCIAYMDDTGRPTVLKSALGEDTTPSVVYFESPTNVVVGRSAKESAILHPNRVVSLIKREMGKTVEFPMYEQKHTPESISALILKELARAAHEQTGEPVRQVVITVPAYFGLAEREATRRAGEIAGLEVLNVVPEPVAAALHYEALGGGEGRTILVYDLGGGTFDTTVIRLEGGDVRVVCTDGHHQLGGADWDDRISDYLLERFIAAHPDKDPSSDEEFLQQLAIDAERLKRDLSSVEVRKPNVRFDGAVEPVEFTRQKFEELTSELLEQTMAITKRTIDTAKERGVSAFDEVLLVGGATKMPAVPRTLRERFGFEPRVHDPDLSVAKGAARYALIESVKVRMPGEGQDAGAAGEKAVSDVAIALGISKEQVRDLANTTIATVAPRGFGVELNDLDDPSLQRTYVDHLIMANDPLPKQVKRGYRTIRDNQVRIEINIWEQAGSLASRELEANTKIGGGAITDVPPMAKGAPLEVTFDMDDMGKLQVHAIEVRHGREVRFELQIGGMDERQLAQARDLVASTEVSE